MQNCKKHTFFHQDLALIEKEICNNKTEAFRQQGLDERYEHSQGTWKPKILSVLEDLTLSSHGRSTHQQLEIHEA